MQASKRGRGRHSRINQRYKTANELNTHISININHNQEYPITTLYEFLLYLPLFNVYRLGDILFKVHGQIGVNRKYVLDQLKYLYSTIEDDDAKEFVEMWRKFYLESPSINSIDDRSQKVIEQNKINDYWDFFDSGEYSRLYRKYHKRLIEFTKNIQFLEDLKIKLSMEEQMRDKNE
jgi:hypothetical protein